MASIWWNGPDRSTFQAFEAQSQRIESSLKAADEALWNEVAALLTPDQAPRLQHLRSKREREYLTADPVVQAWFPGGGPLDVHDMLLQCAPDGMDAAAATIASYEAREAELLRKMRNAIAEARSGWIKGTDGLRKEPVDPDAPMQVLAEHRDLTHPWSAALQPVKEIAADCLHATGDAVKQIAKVLPLEQGRIFESIYFCQQLGEGFTMWFEVEAELTEAAQIPELDEATRATIVAARDRWFQNRAMEWRAFDSFLARRAHSPNAMHVGTGRPPEYDQEAIMGTDRLRIELDRLLYTTLPKATGRRISERVMKQYITPLRDKDPAKFDQRGLNVERGSHSVDSFVPPPLTQMEVERLAAVAGETLSAPDLGAALQGYRAQYDLILEALRPASSAPMGPPTFNMDEVQRRLDVYAESSARLDRLDDGFIAGVEQTLALARTAPLLRLHRAGALGLLAHRTWTPDTLGLPADFTNVFASIDDPGERGLAVASLTERAPGLISELQNYRAVLLRLHQAQELGFASRVARPTAEEEQRDMHAAWERKRQRERDCEGRYQTVAAEADAAHAHLLGMMREIADGGVSPNSNATARTIGRAIGREAFPRVLGDLAAASERLQRARAHKDVMPEQRQTLIDWSIDFNGRCDARLKDSVALLWSLAVAQNQDDMSRAIAGLQIEQMRIDQRQLASEVDAMLRRTLTAEQLAALGMNVEPH